MPRAGLAEVDSYVGYRDEATWAPSGPNPKQALLHASTAYELLYGGSAGGGKSEGCVLDTMLFCLRHPRVQAAIARRTKKELTQSIVLRLLAHLPKHLAVYNSQDGCVKFNNGSLIWLIYCDREHDVFKYQSAQFQLLSIDEASHYTDSMRIYLRSRVRSTVASVRPRVRYYSNPGNVGHAWLKDNFIDPSPELTGGRLIKDYQIWTPSRTAESLAYENLMASAWGVTQQVRPRSRQFIPARLWDNLPLLQANPEYLLELLDQGTDNMRMLLLGDWDVWAGQMFGEFRKLRTVTADMIVSTNYPMGGSVPWHVIPTSTWQVPRGARVFGSVDYGYQAPWAFYLHATGLEHHIVTFHEDYRTRMRDEQQAQRIKEVIARGVENYERRRPGGFQKPEYLVCDPSMWNSRSEMGLAKSIAEVYQDILGPIGVHLVKGASSPGSRIAGVQRMKNALAEAPDGFPWWQMTENCPVLAKQIPTLPRDENNPEDVDTDAEDHAYDSCRYFLSSRPEFPQQLVVPTRVALTDFLATRHHQRLHDEKQARLRHKGALSLGPR